jgi:hypothetical protein
MRNSRFRQPLTCMLLLIALALILSALLSSCASTTKPHAAAPQQLPHPHKVKPAECLPKAFDRFDKWLSQLPGDYLSKTPKERAKCLLRLKGKDARQYRKLLEQAIRCSK